MGQGIVSNSSVTFSNFHKHVIEYPAQSHNGRYNTRIESSKTVLYTNIRHKCYIRREYLAIRVLVFPVLYIVNLGRSKRVAEESKKLNSSVSLSQEHLQTRSIEYLTNIFEKITKKTKESQFWIQNSNAGPKDMTAQRSL